MLLQPPKLSLTQQQLDEGWRFYRSDSSLRSELRFGQYMYNKYATVPCEPWPALFYETDSRRAYELLMTVVREN